MTRVWFKHQWHNGDDVILLVEEDAADVQERLNTFPFAVVTPIEAMHVEGGGWDYVLRGAKTLAIHRDEVRYIVPPRETEG